MEPPAFAKFVALPELLDQLRARFGIEPRMSGSGSACYVLLGDDMEVAPLLEVIRFAWGESAFALESRLA